MSWKADEALRRFFEATLLIKEIHGPERLTDLLEQELHREIVVQNNAANNAVLLSAIDVAAQAKEAARRAGEELEILVKALGFYADATSYEPGKRKISPVVEDKGRLARAALAQIDDESGGENGGEEDE